MDNKYTWDTSSCIHSWDAYPIDNFPKVWEWLEEEIKIGNITFSKTTFDELITKDVSCYKWFKEKTESEIIDQDIINIALEIKDQLGIKNDNYHKKGVGENDIFIIAHAKVVGKILVTEEAQQPDLLKNIAKSKIPAVCRMENIPCYNFLKVINLSGKIF